VDFNIGLTEHRVKTPMRGIQFREEVLLKMQILKPAVLYFAFVFGAGFVLGTIRVLPVVPRIGTRTAELMETRVMIVVSFLAARWIIRVSPFRLRRPSELQSASLRWLSCSPRNSPSCSGFGSDNQRISFQPRSCGRNRGEGKRRIIIKGSVILLDERKTRS